MSEFKTPVDIANRALQHCGASRIDATLGFLEPSRNASETEFAYGKLRQVELRSNFWTFAIKKVPLRALDTDTMLLVPALWVSTTTYFLGSIVADSSGLVWISRTRNNLGNQPESSLTWEPYFGPMSVSLYDSNISYYGGELVYTAAGDGTSKVYVSLISGNEDVPATATAWAATDTYHKDQIVTYLSVAYMSLINLNINQIPSAAPLLYSAATSYSIGNQVGASDGIIYTSLTNGNINHDPTTDGGVNWTNTGVLNPWTRVFVSGTGSLNWRQIGGSEFPMGVSLTTLDIIYPIGSGPSSQGNTRNIFRLPAGWLREAPQDPTAGALTALGGPSGIGFTNWEYDGDFIVTELTGSNNGVIIYRFVADMTDVSRMNAMFCEALAARIGLEVCEPLTQSGEKLKTITALYDKWVGRARQVNGIEQGPIESPEDSYIQCRL